MKKTYYILILFLFISCNSKLIPLVYPPISLKKDYSEDTRNFKEYKGKIEGLPKDRYYKAAIKILLDSTLCSFTSSDMDHTFYIYLDTTCIRRDSYIEIILNDYSPKTILLNDFINSDKNITLIKDKNIITKDTYDNFYRTSLSECETISDRDIIYSTKYLTEDRIHLSNIEEINQLKNGDFYYEDNKTHVLVIGSKLNSNKNGEWRTYLLKYSDDPVLKKIETYSNNYLDGYYYETDNSNFTKQGYYKKNKKYGYWEEIDWKGNIHKEYYKNGKKKTKRRGNL